MWVYSCFEGDEDKALAWVQHDAYFATPRLPGICIERRSTLGWLWYQVMRYCEGRHSTLHGSVETCRVCVRWTVSTTSCCRRITSTLLRISAGRCRVSFGYCVLPDDAEHYPFELLYAWQDFLMRDIPAWLEAPELALAIARRILLQSFEEGDGAADELHRLLFERYRYECVSKTWWAAERAQRLMPGRFSAVTGREATEDIEGRLQSDASRVGSRDQ